jgi:hypothetical protein
VLAPEAKTLRHRIVELSKCKMRNAFQLTCGHGQWTYGLAQVVFQSDRGLFYAETKQMYDHRTMLVKYLNSSCGYYSS